MVIPLATSCIEREIVCVNNLVRKTTPQRGCERYSRSEQSLIGKHASGRAGEQYCELNASITYKQNRRLARQATSHTKTQQLCYKTQSLTNIGRGPPGPPLTRHALARHRGSTPDVSSLQCQAYTTRKYIL